MLIHVPISRREDLDAYHDDDDDYSDNDDDDIIIPVHDAPKTAISRWASQIPPNASPNIAPQDPSRPPCLSIQPTRPSPPTVCLHTPEKVVTYQAEPSPSSSAIPLKRMSSHPHGGFLSTIASHVKSLVTRPHLHSHSSSSESEPENDLWWTLPSSSKHPIPSTSTSASTSTATSYVSSSSSAATFSSTSLHTPSQSYSSSPKTNQRHKPIPIRRSSHNHQTSIGYQDTYFEPQPRYLPIPPSKSSIKQRRLVDDFEELDQWEGEEAGFRRTRTEWGEQGEGEDEDMEYGTPVPLRVQPQPQPPSQSQLRVKTKERRAHHHHHRTTRGTLVSAALVGRL